MHFLSREYIEKYFLLTFPQHNIFCFIEILSGINEKRLFENRKWYIKMHAYCVYTVFINIYRRVWNIFWYQRWWVVSGYQKTKQNFTVTEYFFWCTVKVAWKCMLTNVRALPYPFSCPHPLDIYIRNTDMYWGLRYFRSNADTVRVFWISWAACDDDGFEIYTKLFFYVYII